jgi:hypothetical protein
MAAVNELSIGDGAPDREIQVCALREAYRGGRLVVSADPCALARARLGNGHAIDARDVADAVLREMSALEAFRRGDR